MNLSNFYYLSICLTIRTDQRNIKIVHHCFKQMKVKRDCYYEDVCVKVSAGGTSFIERAGDGDGENMGASTA